jgi:hypothetical protein
MLQDMRDTRIIRWVGLEPDREDIVAILASDVQVFGARLVMAQVQRRQLELGDMLRPQKREAMELLANFRVLREVGRSSRSSLGRTAEHRLAEKYREVNQVNAARLPLLQMMFMETAKF